MIFDTLSIFKWFKKQLKLIVYRKIRKLGAFTIISNNCIAGVIYRKYGIKYYSPTIDLLFPPDDFIKFCANFEYYINCNLEEYKLDEKILNIFTSLTSAHDKMNFPVGKIDDIIIFFIHYKDFEEVRKNGNEEKKE